jgi:hypothetical protein
VLHGVKNVWKCCLSIYKIGTYSTYIYSFIHSSMALQLLLGSGHFFSFIILYMVGATPWTEDQSVARPIPAVLEWDLNP